MGCKLLLTSELSAIYSKHHCIFNAHTWQLQAAMLQHWGACHDQSVYFERFAFQVVCIAVFKGDVVAQVQFAAEPKRKSLCFTILLTLESGQNAPMTAAYWRKCYRVLLFLCANAPSQSRSPHVMGTVRSVQTPHYQAFVIHSSVAVVTRLEGCARARVGYIRRTCSCDS